MRIIFTVFLAFLLFTGLSGQSSDLTLKITGIKKIKGGTVRVAIYNSKETYFNLDKMFRSVELPVDSNVVVHTFSGLPNGEYAVTVFHDEDGNGKMNRKWYGAPAEGYAFSNNYHSALKPASFRDAAFMLEVDQTITIKMVY